MWSTIEEYSIAIKIVNKKIKNKKTAIKILTTHAWLEYIPWPSGHDNELCIYYILWFWSRVCIFV